MCGKNGDYDKRMVRQSVISQQSKLLECLFSDFTDFLIYLRFFGELLDSADFGDFPKNLFRDRSQSKNI